jgi:glyoxylase-like metal-dependent hydrolase (beta-lactamase superfamily II)
MNNPRLNQISQHVYWLPPDATTDRPTLGAVVGERATLIVDAGNSPAHAELFLNELANAGAPAPAYLVLTHSHWDHVFGVSAYDLPVFAYTEAVPRF